MKILGISCFFHDSAAALIINGKIIAAIQEERFTRKKNDPSFPKNAIKYCLNYACLEIDDLDRIVFYENPQETHQPTSCWGNFASSKDWMTTDTSKCS